MEIAPGIHRIQCIFDGTRVSFVHLLLGSEASILVDTCCAHNPSDDILPYMARIGFDPRRLTYILISHSDLDHQGGNAPMKEAAPQALLMCHNLDRPWVESTEALIEGRYDGFREHGIVMSDEAKAGTHHQTLSAPIDMTLEGGERFRLSADWYVEALHTPGHTFGHLAVYDPRSKTLIAGEAALWNAILDLEWKPSMPPTYCYVDTYLATIDRLLTMDIEIYAPSHWPVQYGHAVKDFLRESRNYCQLNERRLLEFAHTGSPFTLLNAIQALAPEAGSWPDALDSVLMYPLRGNLEFLSRRGQLVTGRDDQNRVTWRLP